MDTNATTIVLTDKDCRDEILGVLTVQGKTEPEIRAAINCARANIEDWDIDTLIEAIQNIGWNVSWSNSVTSMSI